MGIKLVAPFRGDQLTILSILDWKQGLRVCCESPHFQLTRSSLEKLRVDWKWDSTSPQRDLSVWQNFAGCRRRISATRSSFSAEVIQPAFSIHPLALPPTRRYYDKSVRSARDEWPLPAVVVTQQNVRQCSWLYNRKTTIFLFLNHEQSLFLRQNKPTVLYQ